MSVTINNLDFSYADFKKQPILRIANWSMKAGETVFLHGPSGVGKSTLLNVISGILPVSSGEITVLDQRIDQLRPRQRDKFRANHIGYVFQQFNLISYLSVMDNVRLAQHFSTNKTQHPQHPVDVKQLLVALNIDSQLWNKTANQLSIGQQQRVAIARAFVNQPKLLIVDEPTSALDAKNRDDFMTLLMNNVEQCHTTLIFVSHDRSLSNYFSRVESILDINHLEGTL